MAQSVPPGDIATQPGTKIVFNAPCDDKHTYHIKVTSPSARHMTRLGVDPGSGVLEPKEAALSTLHSGEKKSSARVNASKNTQREQKDGTEDARDSEALERFEAVLDDFKADLHEEAKRLVVYMDDGQEHLLYRINEVADGRRLMRALYHLNEADTVLKIRMGSGDGAVAAFIKEVQTECLRLYFSGARIPLLMLLHDCPEAYLIETGGHGSPSNSSYEKKEQVGFTTMRDPNSVLVVDFKGFPDEKCDLFHYPFVRGPVEALKDSNSIRRTIDAIKASLTEAITLVVVVVRSHGGFRASDGVYCVIPLGTAAEQQDQTNWLPLKEVIVALDELNVPIILNIDGCRTATPLSTHEHFATGNVFPLFSCSYNNVYFSTNPDDVRRRLLRVLRAHESMDEVVTRLRNFTPRPLLIPAEDGNSTRSKIEFQA